MLRAVAKWITEHVLGSLLVTIIGGVVVGVLLATLNESDSDSGQTITFPTPVPTVPPKASLDWVDVFVTQDPEQSTATFDIKVINTGDQIALIKQVEFQIEFYSRATFSGALPGSASYEFELPVSIAESEIPFSISYPVSQTVDPGDVDRFTVVMGIPDNTALQHIYGIRLRLLYNQEGETPQSDQFDVRLFR